MKLHFETECGEKTCASEPGKFCYFVRVKNFGTSYLCLYYDEKLYDNDGWLIRCPKCLNEQRKENGIEQSTSF
jgi:hypothetical protein